MVKKKINRFKGNNFIKQPVKNTLTENLSHIIKLAQGPPIVITNIVFIHGSSKLLQCGPELTVVTSFKHLPKPDQTPHQTPEHYDTPDTSRHLPVVKDKPEMIPEERGDTQ